MSSLVIESAPRPAKSVAIALLFAVFLGPVGLLYASLRGGILLVILAITFACMKFLFLTFLVWLAACIWAVAAVESRLKRGV